MHEKDLLGVTLGNTTLERLIGRGGMAWVFLAQQARPTRTVAVKVLVPESQNISEDQQSVFLERFRREADTAARLEHKNILPIYEYAEGQVNGQKLAYLVMPYIRGGTLRQRIDDVVHEGKTFDLSTVVSYVSQVADALGYAHSLGVVHRDVKPGNLLFHSDGRLLLTDFGIARLSAMPALTMAGSFVGTPEYASPEQVSGNLNEVDARSDIYSLGIILYELLTGSVPFTGSTPFEVMARQLHDPVPSVRVQRPDLSPSIEFVVKKALAKDPKDRYQHANELAADLQAAVKPALAQAGGLRLTGDAGNTDLTVADGSWKPALLPLPDVQSPAASAGVGAAVAIPPTAPAQIQTPRVPTSRPPLPTGGVQVQIPQSDADLERDVQVRRPGRRLYFYIVGLVSLVLECITLVLTLHNGSDTSSVALGVLLGNALNLLSLAAIAFTAVTRARDLRMVFNRVIWIITATLILSGFFISYGATSSNSVYLPLISYIILLASNIYLLRQLSRVDVKNEQIQAAPVAWRAALVGALTGLIPLVIILVFSLLAPLPWAYGNSPFLRLLIPLVIAFIGAPTPGSMMAVWLSQKMSFPILMRTSAVAGFLMFLGAYLLVALCGLLVTGQIFTAEFSTQTQFVAVLILGGLLGLVGLLRGQLDAWVYHRVMLRRRV